MTETPENTLTPIEGQMDSPRSMDSPRRMDGPRSMDSPRDEQTPPEVVVNSLKACSDTRMNQCSRCHIQFGMGCARALKLEAAATIQELSKEINTCTR